MKIGGNRYRIVVMSGMILEYWTWAMIKSYPNSQELKQGLKSFCKIVMPSVLLV